MPIGIIINGSSVLVGGLLGALLGKFVPERVRTTLSLIFGVCSMSMGILYIGRVNALPVVVLSIILGVAIGELIFLEKGIAVGIGKIRGPMMSFTGSKDDGGDKEEWMTKFIGIVVLFCASGTGIFGALESGMTGDHTTLITKSILDFFTAATFAITLGYLVALICIPQVIIMLILFFSATFILPFTNDLMRADFTACGGVIMLATGLRISGIKTFPIANMLPAMILVMPLSNLWTVYIVPQLAQLIK